MSAGRVLAEMQETFPLFQPGWRPWPETSEGALNSPNRQWLPCLDDKSNFNSALILSFAALRVFISRP